MFVINTSLCSFIERLYDMVKKPSVWIMSRLFTLCINCYCGRITLSHSIKMDLSLWTVFFFIYYYYCNRQQLL